MPIRIALITGLFLMTFNSFAQISTPEKRKFNIGLAGGLSVWKFRPMVALDISYKGSMLRLMPNYNYYSIGYSQEILKISPVFYNLYWTASAYAGYQIEPQTVPSISSSDFNTYTYTGVINTGIRTYFGKRLYTNLTGGVMYEKHVTPLTSKTSTDLLPYFEFTLGVQIFKTYPHLKAEETKE